MRNRLENNITIIDLEKTASDFDMNKGGAFNHTLLQEEDQNSIYLSLKNYNTRRGVSKMMHLKDQQQNFFYVKGPIGSGYKFIPNNVNVAFVAGTGILSIFDMIARFCLYNCGEF